MKSTSFALGVIIAFAAPLGAQTNTVATDPVGYMRYVFQGASDTSMSLPLHRPTEYAGAVNQVGSNWIAVSPAQGGWTNNYWAHGVTSNANNTYYAMFTTGALEGAWFQITGNNSNTLFLDTAGFASLPGAGVAVSNSFEVIPFWTLGTVFPGGTGIVASSDPFTAQTIVLLTDQESAGVNLSAPALFFYFDGTGGFPEAGWYPVGNPFAAKADNDPLPPDSFFIVRSPATQTTNFVTGAVAMNNFRTAIGNIANGVQQDNFVGFGFPIDTALADCGLQNSPGFQQSPDPFSPVDILMLYNQDAAGVNKSVAQLFFYHDGTSGFFPAGWYKVGDPFSGSQDSVVIRAGVGVIVRKAPAAAGAAAWSATPSYKD